MSHWVAFLGIDDRGIRILDIPRPLQRLTFADLLVSWDGIGISIVPPDQDAPHTGTIPVARRFLFVADEILILVVVLWVFDTLSSRWFSSERKSGSYCGGAIVLFLIVAASSAALFHYVSPVGFFRNAGAVAAVARRYHREKAPEVAIGDVKEAIDHKDAVIIDARRGEDFLRGHIPGALSVPVDSVSEVRQRVIKTLSKSRTIIVYCKSSGCTWADDVATYLMESGCQKVRIYRDGYIGWVRELGTSERTVRATADGEP